MGAISGKAFPDGGFPTLMWGKLVADPKSTVTAKGEPKVSFSLLIHSSKDDTDRSKNFANVTFYGDNFNTRVAASLEKGDMIFVCGDYVTSHYQGKDGSPKTWTEIRVSKSNGFLVCEEAMKQLYNMMANGVPASGNNSASPASAFVPAEKPVSIQFAEDDSEDLPF